MGSQTLQFCFNVYVGAEETLCVSVEEASDASSSVVANNVVRRKKTNRH